MKKELFRYLNLYWGLFIGALGTMILLKSDMGMPAWDVLHQGLSIVSNGAITIGQACIIVGVLIALFDIVFGQPIGSGTIANFIFVGLYMDIIMYLDFIPEPTNLAMQIVELVLGILLYTYGTYLYMIQELGCGPRDAMLQIVTTKSNKSVSLVKNTTEIVVLSLGWFLGGKVGPATLVNAILMGVLLEQMFKLGKVDIKELQHRNVVEEINLFKNFLKRVRN